MKNKTKNTEFNISQIEFRRLLVKKTGGCSIQADGWPCGTCFFTLSDDLTNADWQSVLYFRGDTPIDVLDNLPRDYLNNIERIVKICREVKE